MDSENIAVQLRGDASQATSTFTRMGRAIRDLKSDLHDLLTLDDDCDMATARLDDREAA